MKKHIKEIFEEIQADPKAIEQYKGNGALKTLFEHAFDPSKKFILPEGNPPFKEDDAPFTMSPTSLLYECRRLYIFLREDLNAVKRESLFISLLESIHPDEAKIVLAIKDQKLHKLYSKLTHKLAYDNGFVEVEPPKKKVTKKKSAAA